MSRPPPEALGRRAGDGTVMQTAADGNVTARKEDRRRRLLYAYWVRTDKSTDVWEILRPRDRTHWREHPVDVPHQRLASTPTSYRIRSPPTFNRDRPNDDFFFFQKLYIYTFFRPVRVKELPISNASTRNTYPRSLLWWHGRRQEHIVAGTGTLHKPRDRDDIYFIFLSWRGREKKKFQIERAKNKKITYEQNMLLTRWLRGTEIAAHHAAVVVAHEFLTDETCLTPKPN